MEGGESVTPQEAIKVIQDYDVNGCGYCHQGGDEVEEAFDMAIKALEKQYVPDTNVGDTISRQAAIDAVEKESQIDGAYGYMDTKSIIDLLEDLPSVQPEQRWIPCSEQLPGKDGDYLVCYEEGYREDYGFDEIGIAPFEVDCEGFGIWQEHFDNYTLGSLGSDWVDISVIAWMPLPEPYKGES